jgi:predicted DNA-binding transcriptional regulator AlpA
MANGDARRSPVLKAAEAYMMTLSTVGKGKSARPVIRVLMSDGRTTEFAERAIVIPEGGPDEASQQVFALLINGNGEVYVDPDGQPVVLAVPAVTLETAQDGNRMLTLADVAKHSSTSLATIRRRIEDGTLPQPTQISKRRVAMPLSAVKRWLDSR